MSTEPADLPIFADPPARTNGRVRSTFRFTPDPPEPEPAELADPMAPVAQLRPRPATPTPRRPDGPAVELDWALVGRMRTEVARRLAERLGEDRWERDAEQAEGRAIITRVLEEDTADQIVHAGQARSLAEQEAIAKAVFDAVFGLGRLQPLIDDPNVENIMVTRFDRVLVERADGTIWEAPPVAENDDELADLLSNQAGRSENPRSFTPANPSLHLMLPGGARLAAARDTAGVSVVIRRHRMRQVTLADLQHWGTITPTMAGFLAAAVRARLSIVVSGAQGAGKTTLLRALCSQIDRSEPIGTFESEYELFLHEMPDQHACVHAWEAREGSGERGPDGLRAGARTTAQQIVDSFRFNLSRQILGEIRGEEVWSMVKLMESGSGSLSTTHSASAQRTMRKLVTCAMEAGPQVNQDLAAGKLGETVDLVVHIACDSVPGPDGSVGRKHRYVEEILAVSPGERPRGYATTAVFARRDGRCAAAHTMPDELRAVLAGAGFNLARFEAEIIEEEALR